MTDRTKTSRPQKSKWYRKPLKLDGINFNKNHFLVGFQWPYTNCMGTTYLTTMTAEGGRPAIFEWEDIKHDKAEIQKRIDALELLLDWYCTPDQLEELRLA